MKTIESHVTDGCIPSMCNFTECIKEVSDPSPWIPTAYLYRPGVDGLHTEIEQFNAFMMSTPAERALRIQVVRRIESLVLQVWPNARVQIFGSFRLGMFLPDSDIDLDISRISDRFPLRVLKAKLLASDIAEPNSIVAIEKTRVPVIKFIDRRSKHQVDISFNNKWVVGKIELINEYKRKYPVLQKLVIILKRFLALHKLNDAPTGGISSFTLVLMCISFLQLQPTDRMGEDANLGVLLLDFLKLYGKTFDYSTSCIRIGNGGQYLHKDNALSKMAHGRQKQFLCIEDPLIPRINTACPSHRAHQAKCAFENAFNLLSNAISSTQNGEEFSQHNGTLGRIVQVSPQLIEYRNWVHGTFNHTLT